MKRYIKSGELLAIKPDRIHHDASGAWWDSEVKVPPNEVRGDVHVVYIRGELEHHDGPNSYDAIDSRAAEAFDCPDTSKVLLCIDSPGGDVAGLNAFVRKLRKRADDSGKAFVGYVNEMCASAAYAISTACDELYCPDSAIIGAIGVIATMADQTAADKRMGLNFVTLTSGARKADGHPHVPISPGAVSAEQARVDRSARTFWAMVGQSRGLSPATVQGYEAGIFVGKLAVKAGLCDGVLDLDELIETLTDEKSVAQPGQDVPVSPPSPGTPSAATEPSMLALKALLKRTRALLAKATDPKVKASLSSACASYEASLKAYKKVKKTVKYEAESDEGDMEAEEAEESEEAEEEEEKGNETDRKEGDVHVHADDDGDDKDDDDDDDAEEEEEEEESRKAKKAKFPDKKEKVAAKSAKASATRGAIAGLNARLDRIEKDTVRRNQSALINEALAARRITRAQAKHLAGESHGFVRSFLKMNTKPLVAIDEDSLELPDGTPHADIPREAMRQIEMAVESMNLGTAEKAKLVRDEMIAEHRKSFARANGAGRF